MTRSPTPVASKSDYFTNNNIQPIVVEAPGTVKVGPDEEPTTFSIGWRIQPGRIDCYFNDQKVITCTNVPADMGTIRKSPILLTNAACYIEFDNFTVATYDYNLFNEKPDENVNGGDNVNGGNATEIVTAIETDENGETVIVTKVVADTNKNTPNASNGGSGTGDMIVVVAAVMAVSAAGAVILAKRRKEKLSFSETQITFAPRLMAGRFFSASPACSGKIYFFVILLLIFFVKCVKIIASIGCIDQITLRKGTQHEKDFSILLCLLMIASIAASSVSAAGAILLKTSSTAWTMRTGAGSHLTLK